MKPRVFNEGQYKKQISTYFNAKNLISVAQKSGLRIH